MQNDDSQFELFKVDIDLRTIETDVNCNIKVCGVQLTQEEVAVVNENIQKCCEILVNALRKKIISILEKSKFQEDWT